ncbi:uncharacterized protein LOC112269413 isoform X1 [Brachypodium distachyon]|uniref:Uncharacterized protein n=1 Tax=Brachypodium distachyon TaxID=15368 RepID=A0A2K2CGI7_BRADI|nr:uncharacterized protein LOC112269413 isoform X1 [Brachypodium distachyon]XP_024311892.1 uncharacterized protein LOC112269413 isoform X1 [Brachypodium distachyon]XP_024311894.1 uncharacterized protein LOC112269413 isoform X1 [Brachypodium distachyon]XP_024311895.1 uncharacterized protein LOC112269413 isoform X1 [Brachypodium distachyon]PNT61140.1 hypothetical protein BRADI_5g10835v3 [Brachypodium distachyon]PNT61141.1 hypothetical protein BRADI_5g10835v3 [Brachypodium distachyon]PNT61142.1 |eukprot:XP_024311891.1 uncharacterized protein LOC112269413 isoform X1 [Brachypodium distachyon]
MDKLKARKYVEMIQRLERHVLISRRELVDNCMTQAKRLKVDEVGETSSQTERVLVGVPVLDGMVMGGRVLPVTQSIDSTPVVYETLTQAVRAEGDSVAGDGIEAMLGQKPSSDSAGEKLIAKFMHDGTGPHAGMFPNVVDLSSPIVLGLCIAGTAGGCCCLNKGSPRFDSPVRFNETPICAASGKRNRITAKAGNTCAPLGSAECEAAKEIMDMSKSVSKINSCEPGESPFELGLCQQQPSIRAANKFRSILMAASVTELQRIWFKHLVPADLELIGHALKMMFGGDGCWGNNEMDAATRLFAEMDAEMMAGIDAPTWRHLVSLVFSADMSVMRDVDGTNGYIEMFKGCKYQYDINGCRMIMCLVQLDSAWCLYVFDQVKKMLSAPDPIYTDKSSDRCRMKHHITISRLSIALKNVGKLLGNSWVIDPKAWQIKFNSKMHRQCQNRTLTGSYVIYYAREFDGEGIAHVPTEVELQEINASTVNGIAGMKGNLATNPSFAPYCCGVEVLRIIKHCTMRPK